MHPKEDTHITHKQRFTFLSCQLGLFWCWADFRTWFPFKIRLLSWSLTFDWQNFFGTIMSVLICCNLLFFFNFSPFYSIYQLNSFMKFWKPSSPKKSKEPWDEPRWMRRRTSRTMARSGMRRFQPAARMLYHLALSEHSWAICRFPWVFWSLAYRDTYKHTLILAHAAVEESNRVVSRPLQYIKNFVFSWFVHTKKWNAWLMSTLTYTVNCERRRAAEA